MLLSWLFCFLPLLVFPTEGIDCWEGKFLPKTNVPKSRILRNWGIRDYCEIEILFPEICETVEDAKLISFESVKPKQHSQFSDPGKGTKAHCEITGQLQTGDRREFIYATIKYKDPALTMAEPLDILKYLAHTPSLCDYDERLYKWWTCALLTDSNVAKELEKPGCSENGTLRNGITGKNGQVKGCKVMEDMWMEICEDHILRNCTVREQFDPVDNKTVPYIAPLASNPSANRNSNGKNGKDDDKEEESSSLPVWAIAVMAIEGVLLIIVPIVASVVVYFIMAKRMKKRSKIDHDDRKEESRRQHRHAKETETFTTVTITPTKSPTKSPGKFPAKSPAKSPSKR